MTISWTDAPRCSIMFYPIFLQVHLLFYSILHVRITLGRVLCLYSAHTRFPMPYPKLHISPFRYVLYTMHAVHTDSLWTIELYCILYILSRTLIPYLPSPIPPVPEKQLPGVYSVQEHTYPVLYIADISILSYSHGYSCARHGS